MEWLLLLVAVELAGVGALHHLSSSSSLLSCSMKRVIEIQAIQRKWSSSEFDAKTTIRNSKRIELLDMTDLDGDCHCWSLLIVELGFNCN
jgi:hypothetical protein